ADYFIQFAHRVHKPGRYKTEESLDTQTDGFGPPARIGQAWRQWLSSNYTPADVPGFAIAVRLSIPARGSLGSKCASPEPTLAADAIREFVRLQAEGFGSPK